MNIVYKPSIKVRLDNFIDASLPKRSIDYLELDEEESYMFLVEFVFPSKREWRDVEFHSYRGLKIKLVDNAHEL